MISGIAIVSKINEPVILRTYVDAEDGIPTISGREVVNPDDHPTCPQLTVASAELRLHHVIYCSLDDKAWTDGKGKRNDMFIGHLSTMDNFRCYGYVSGTQTKIIAVLDDNENIRENEIEKAGKPLQWGRNMMAEFVIPTVAYRGNIIPSSALVAGGLLISP